MADEKRLHHCPTCVCVVPDAESKPSPPMPEWASPDGPWCLRQWIRFDARPQTATTCLLPPDHDGDCRDQLEWHVSRSNALFVGQLKMKAS